METWLTASPYPGMILWMALYISDYYLTVNAAKGFQEIGRFQYEGSYELTPQFQKDIDARNKVSSRHVAFLIILTALIGLLWLLCDKLIHSPWLYLLYLGMFLLLEVAVHVRHFRNLHIIRIVKAEGGVEGTVRYAKRFSYKVSAMDLYLSAGVFLLVFLLTLSPFFLGGALSCLITGIRHAQLAGKFPKVKEAHESPTASS